MHRRVVTKTRVQLASHRNVLLLLDLEDISELVHKDSEVSVPVLPEYRMCVLISDCITGETRDVEMKQVVEQTISHRSNNETTNWCDNY